jgi:hypothetical protein
MNRSNYAQVILYGGRSQTYLQLWHEGVFVICYKSKHGNDAELGITSLRFNVVRVCLAEMTKTYH